MSTDPFLNRVALVTGGSRGIGFAIAQALAAKGCSVVITGLDHARLDAAKLKLQAEGARVEAVAADVGDPTQVRHAVAFTARQYGGLDILVNNAGIGGFTPVAEMSDADWQGIMSTNVSGVFYSCRECIPLMRQHGGGWIINISSLAAKNAFAGGGAYCASKAALNAFTEVLMQEVRYDGIRVSTVMPGSVDTSFGGNETAATWKLTPEDVASVVVGLIAQDPRSLPSRIELRPSQPPRK